MKIQAFLFTKDRACQAHLLLSSLRRNAPGLFRPYILWRASCPQYREAYCKLRDMDVVPGSLWVEERDIRTDFLDALSSPEELTCIFTDDSIFFRRCGANYAEVLAAFDERTLSFSFRLGLNTTLQDYRTGRLQRPLANYEKVLDYWGPHDDGIIRWRYSDHPSQDNYGYPYAMDGCTYRTKHLFDVTSKFERLTCFRDWEGCLSNPSRHPKDLPMLASLEHSCVVNVPTNSVQEPPLAAGHVYPVSLEELNRRFLSGEVIDLDAFDFSNVVGCHQEFPLRFKRSTN